MKDPATLPAFIDDISFVQTESIKKGSYWQGLRTLNDAEKKPTNGKTWEEMEIVPNLDGCEVAVHVYDGPDGAGYVIELRKDGYIKAINFGNETERSHEWVLIPVLDHAT